MRWCAAHAWFLASALVCLFVFGWMVTLGTFRFVAVDEFGNFYDHQAAAWLQGRWDVPESALSGEAFIVEGKVYGYFGPTPALMRLPFALLGIGFGQLTRVLMLLDYVVYLAGAYALLRLAVRWREPQAEPAPRTVVLFMATAGLGSMVFFLASRAYVYHEAILCGAACAVWSVFFALRYLNEPSSRAWIGALICGTLAVHARAPIGLFALTVLGCAAVMHAWRGRQIAALGVAAASVLGVLSFNAVSYVKFGTFEGCPLRFNVQYTPEKLAVLGDRNFHLGNLRFNSDAYLLRPSFSLRPEFPYIFREFIDRREYPESRLAYRDQTLAMPWAMPGLFWLAVVGSMVAVGRTTAWRPPVALLWLAALPAALAMLMAVAVTQRYEADFCPFLVAALAFGLPALEVLPPSWRRMGIALATVLSVVGVLISFALTLHHQREIVWGVPEDARQNYQRMRAQVDAFFGAEKPR